MQTEPTKAEPSNNAATSRPFQFSMRQMFLMVALFCVAIAMLLKADRYYNDVVLEEGTGEIVFEGMRAAGFTAIGAGIGVILRRPFLCAAVVAIVCCVRLMIPRVY